MIPKPIAILLATGLLLAPGPCIAGDAETGDSDGERTNPQQGSSYRVSLNPDITVNVRAGDDIDSFLTFLADTFNSVTSDYVATHPPGTGGLTFLRSNGDEIDNLRLAENDPVVQSTVLTVSRTGLEAIIGAIVEAPSGGTLFVTLNERTVPVSTAGLTTASQVTDALLQAIQDDGWHAVLTSSFIVVRRDLNGGKTLTRVGLRSTDPSIVTSDLSLAPSGPTIPALAPTGLALLAVLIAIAGSLLLGRRTRGSRPAV